MSETFNCSVCEKLKPVSKSGGTGYAIASLDKDGVKICYACCADLDKDFMKETGKITLYLTDDGSRRFVGNFPGTLKFKLRHGPKKGGHNIAGARYDVWFKGPDGYEWHGVQYGENTQLCHCKRTARR